MGLVHPLISRAFSAFIVHSQKLEKDQAEISNLQVGTYVFQLTVTDTAQQQDFTEPGSFASPVLRGQIGKEHSQQSGLACQLLTVEACT